MSFHSQSHSPALYFQRSCELAVKAALSPVTFPGETQFSHRAGKKRSSHESRYIRKYARAVVQRGTPCAGCSRMIGRGMSGLFLVALVNQLRRDAGDIDAGRITRGGPGQESSARETHPLRGSFVLLFCLRHSLVCFVYGGGSEEF